MLTTEQAKALLTDIACCSLMRLDQTSMDKLWELMVTIFKWQLSITTTTQNLMDITFRHLDGIARLMPELRKSIRADANKQILIDFWDQVNESGRVNIFNNVNQWLKPFNTRISILLRLGLQNHDGSFVENPVNNEFFDHYSECPGSNIYAKTAHLLPRDVEKMANTSVQSTSSTETHAFDALSDQLGICQAVAKTSLPNNPVNLLDMLAVVTVNLPEYLENAKTSEQPTLDKANDEEDLGDLV